MIWYIKYFVSIAHNSHRAGRYLVDNRMYMTYSTTCYKV